MSRKIQLRLPFDGDLEKALNKKIQGLKDYRILSKSLDARGAPRGKVPSFNYTVEYVLNDEKFSADEFDPSKVSPLNQRPVIIGAGPAGLFCALRLVERGVPSIILERGKPAFERMKHIARHWRYGEFDSENNVCFGEGGAGLFSDGKLISRVKSPHIKYVMNKLVEFGAPKETAYISNPHLGSNKIRGLISRLTDYLKENGVEIHYSSRVDSILCDNKQVTGVALSDGKEFRSDHIVLAAGHSASDLYVHLKKLGISLKGKSFAVGVRVEHPRAYIDEIQYGKFCDRPEIGTARYRLSYHDEKSERGTYSFCMCPGGYVLSSGTDADGIVVNGMSNFSRSSPWSNSAFVVSIKAGEDFDDGDPLSGLAFQREIEIDAFKASQKYASGKEVPSMQMTNFLGGKQPPSVVKNSCPSGVFQMDLEDLLPKFISKHLKNGFEHFEKSMPGFIHEKALLMAPETRTSAPVTIVRDYTTFESTSHKGLYPCGEGAGYAGGITSAAVDGIRVADSIVDGQTKN